MIWINFKLTYTRIKIMAVTRLKPLYDKVGTLKGYVDKYTGEEYGFPIIVGRKKNPYSKGWVMNSQEAMVILAKDKEIKGETHRVLWFIGGILDFENWVQLSISEIAEELELKQPNVSRAIKLLEKKEIIIRGPKVGRCYAFMLNPEFGWKGKVKNLDEYRKERNDQERKQKVQQIRKENLKSVDLTSEEQIIDAVKEGKIDIDKLSNLLSELQKV